MAFSMKILRRYLVNMLFRVVVFDSALEPIPGKEEILYNSLYRFLRDIRKCGVILIDENEEVQQRFLEALRKWNYLSELTDEVYNGQDLLRLFKVLHQENRLIGTSFEEKKLNCTSKSCSLYLNIVQSKKTEFIVTNQVCYSCAKDDLSHLPETHLVQMTKYDHNVELQRRVDLRGVRINQCGWDNQKTFEEEVLIPIFRDTENVTLNDKQAGDYFNDNYKATVKWFLKVYLDYARSPKNGTFELRIGKLKTGSQGQKRKQLLCEFEREMKEMYPAFKVVYKSHFSHDRFIGTDQVQIDIGRGLDLLDNIKDAYPRLLKETKIGYIDTI